METALVIAVAIAVALAYALHAILLLRWCGQWTRNRRLVLWVSQMLFPFTTGLASARLGDEIVLWAYDAGLEIPANASAAVVAALTPLVYTPSYFVLSVGIMIGPAIVIRGRWRVLGSAMTGVVGAWAFGALVFYVSGNLWISSIAAMISWHLGALGAPLALAWRVRAKRKRALGGRACLDCGYDLAGVTLPRCPECGAKRKESAEEH